MIAMLRAPMWTYAVALLLAAAGNAACQNAKPKPVKVALVTRQASDSISSLLDLAQAKLSRDERLDLLERQAMALLLKEHNLSLSGLVDAATAVKAGQILAAELFAILETTNEGKEAVALVVYDSATGIKYVDHTLAAGELPAQADGIVESVVAALKKREQGAKNLKLLGVLTVRNADLPQAKDSFCHAQAAILERDLSNSPGVALLERKRLEFLLKEKTLAKDAAAQRLLSSLFMLELEFGRAKSGKGVRATAFLSDGKGKRVESFRVEGKDANGADLAGLLSSSIRKHLQVAQRAQAGDLKLESRRFAAEAVLLWSFEQPSQAFAAVEAALALNPANLEARQHQIEILSRHADRMLKESLEKAARADAPYFAVTPNDAQALLAAHLRSLQLHLELFADHESQGPQTAFAKVTSPLNNRCFHHQNMQLTYLIAARSLNGDLTAMRDAAQTVYLQMVRKEAHAFAELTRQNPSFLLGYSSYLRGHQIVGKVPATTEAYAKTVNQLVRDWSEITRQPKVLDYLLQPQMLHQYSLWSPRLKDVETEGLRPLLDHPHPWLAMDAKVFMILSKLDPRKTSTDDRYQGFQLAKKAFIEAIATSKKIKDSLQRQALRERVYQSWYANIQAFSIGIDKYVQERTALCDFMLEQNDLVREVLVWILPQGSAVGPSPAERWRLLRKAVAVVDASPLRKESALRGLRKTLLGYRDAILKLEPKLAASDPKLAEEDAYADVAVPFQTRLIFHVKDVPRLKTLRHPFVHEGQLYCLAVVGDRPSVQLPLENAAISLVRLSRDKGAADLLSQLPVTTGRKDIKAEQFLISSFCFGGDTVYVGTHYDGVIALPLFKKAGRKLKLDLPGKAVAMAYLNDSLFAHLEGGYLVEINPRTDAVTTLASSRRKDRLSPFDDALPFKVTFMTADPERNRVLFLLLQPEGKESAADRKGTSGFWEYAAKTGKFTRHLEATSSTSAAASTMHLSFGTPLREGKLLLSSSLATVEFDAVTNKGRLLRCPAATPVPTLPAESALTRGLSGLSRARLVENDSLWSLSGDGLVRLELTGRQEQFPSLGKAIPRLWTPNAGYLVPLGPQEWLVGGSEGFALLTFPKEHPSGVRHLEEKRRYSHGHEITGMDFAQSEQILAVMDVRGKLTLGPLFVGKPRQEFAAHHQDAAVLALSPDGKQVATAGRDRLIKIWDVSSRKLRGTLKGHGHGITHLAWLAEGARLASADLDGTLLLWDPRSGDRLHEVKGSKVTSFAAVPGRKQFLTAHRDDAAKRSAIKLWDLENLQASRLMVEHAQPIDSLAACGKFFAWSGRHTATPTSGYQVIHITDLISATEIHALKGSVNEIFSALTISPDEGLLAAVTGSRVWLWDAASGRLLLESILSAKRLQPARFAWDGQHLLTASDGIVRQWNLPVDGGGK
jgi:hypothetical protein